MSKVSIITINYNNGKGLQHTIESVIQQSVNDFEFIVIDGNSLDNSKEIISNYKSQLTYAISEPDYGIYNAMNKGIAKANYEYLLFLNSGDILENKDVIKNIQTYLNDSDIVSGDILIEDAKGEHYVPSRDEVTLDFFFNISLFHQATFIKRQLFLDLGLYNESFKIGGDYEFFIRALYKYNCTYKHTPILISKFKTDGISNDPAYIEINKIEAKKAWLLNVSPRTYEAFSRCYEFYSSDEHYLKTRSPLFRLATKFSKFMFSIRFFFYKTFKEKKAK